MLKVILVMTVFKVVCELMKLKEIDKLEEEHINLVGDA